MIIIIIIVLSPWVRDSWNCNVGLPSFKKQPTKKFQICFSKIKSFSLNTLKRILEGLYSSSQNMSYNDVARLYFRLCKLERWVTPSNDWLGCTDVSNCWFFADTLPDTNESDISRQENGKTGKKNCQQKARIRPWLARWMNGCCEEEEVDKSLWRKNRRSPRCRLWQ